jgi:hypothetical protein
MLPSLARLRWEGFEVSVAAVRGVDLDERDEDDDEDEDERPFLGGRAKTALLRCIEGEGEPPLKLLLAAVACAGSGEISGIPVQMMRDDSVSELDLQERNIGAGGGMLLAYLVPAMGGLTSINMSRNNLTNFGRDMTGIKELAAALGVNGSLTVTNLLGNQLDAESAKMLAEVAKKKGISLCGIRRDQTTADFSNQNLQLPDAILLASDLSQAIVTGALTHLSLVGNEKLGDKGVEALSVAIEQSKSLRTLDLSSDSSTMFGPKGTTALAKALTINSSLTQIEYISPDSNLPNVDNSLPEHLSSFGTCS